MLRFLFWLRRDNYLYCSCFSWCIINCFVHIIMFALSVSTPPPFLLLFSFPFFFLSNPPPFSRYFYWALVSRSFDVRSWKKQITQLQLLQFFVAFGMLMHGYSLGVYCIYAPLYDLSMIVLLAIFIIVIIFSLPLLLERKKRANNDFLKEK